MHLGTAMMEVRPIQHGIQENIFGDLPGPSLVFWGTGHKFESPNNAYGLKPSRKILPVQSGSEHSIHKMTRTLTLSKSLLMSRCIHARGLTVTRKYGLILSLVQQFIWPCVPTYYSVMFLFLLCNIITVSQEARRHWHRIPMGVTGFESPLPSRTVVYLFYPA